MTKTQIVNVLRAVGIQFSDQDDVIFVDNRDAPETGPKDKAIRLLMKATRFDIADKGIIFYC